MSDKIKKESKKRFATLLKPSQVEKIDKLAVELNTSRAALYDEAGELVLEKYNGGEKIIR